MKYLRDFLVCLLLASGCLAGLSVVWFTWEAMLLLQDAQLTILSVNLAVEELTGTILDVRQRIPMLSDSLDRKSELALLEVDAARRGLMLQVSGVRRDVREIADKLDTPLEQLSAIRHDFREEMRTLQPAMESVAHATAQVDAALPGILKSVTDSLEPLSDTVRSVQVVAGATEKSGPPILRNVQRITNDSSVIVRATVKARPNWFMRMLGFKGKR